MRRICATSASITSLQVKNSSLVDNFVLGHLVRHLSHQRVDQLASRIHDAPKRADEENAGKGHARGCPVQAGAALVLAGLFCGAGRALLLLAGLFCCQQGSSAARTSKPAKRQALAEKAKAAEWGVF
jgi:hypothetical protein